MIFSLQNIVLYNENVYLNFGLMNWKIFNLKNENIENFNIKIGDEINKNQCINDNKSIIFDNNIYIFGGFNGIDYLNDLYQLNLESKTLTKIKTYGEIPIKRKNYSSVLIGNKFYIFGGVTK
jgi:hypothetical protein